MIMRNKLRGEADHDDDHDHDHDDQRMTNYGENDDHVYWADQIMIGVLQGGGGGSLSVG